MIDTLRTLAQPLSHWLLDNRDPVIVGLGLLLMWTTGQALLSRWRSQRLQQDMAPSQNSRAVMRRTYATTAPTAKAPEPESPSGLPPVRGGRTYARNLGNALQKAGIAPPPVYSPPTPTGWGPGPTPPPGRAPQAPPTYTPGAPPWATPVQPVQPPIQAPAGANPWPTYVPPTQPRPMPAPPSQPAGQPSLPFFAGPRGPMGPAVAPPASHPPAQYPMPAAPPTMAPFPAPQPSPGWSLSEPIPPPLPAYSAAAPAPAPEAPPAAPAEKPAAKPKRRRFSLSVLQNLEKTLQRTTGFGGQPSPVAEPPVVAPAPAPEAIPDFPKEVAPAAPVVAKVVAAPPSPIPTPTPVREEAPAPVAEPEEAPAPVAEQEPAPPEAEYEEAAPPVAEAEETVAQAEEPRAPAPEAEAEPTIFEPEPEVSGTRAAMRAMLFGEDEKVSTESEAAKPTVAAEPEPAPEPEEPVFRFEPVVPETAEAPDYAAPEEAAQPVESTAVTYEPPVEATTEPVHSLWEPEPPEFAPAMPEAEPEPVPAASSFEPATMEPAISEIYSGTPDSGDTPTGGDRGRVVIIEDDPSVAEYYATLFRGNGYSVHVAGDGVTGVDLCAKVQPQVILLDVMMPRQNGMLVLQTLRASDETKDTPVVVLSNFSEPTLVKRALQLGALEYVIKTQVEGAALLEAMPRWLNREKAFAAA